MHSTFVYSLKLSVLRGAGGKALATDHRDLQKVLDNISVLKLCAASLDVSCTLYTVHCTLSVLLHILICFSLTSSHYKVSFEYQVRFLRRMKMQ